MAQITWLALALLLFTTLHAEVRSSASYSIEAETLDGGGGLSTSAAYTNEGSLEPLVAGESTSTSHHVMHGFVTGMTVATLSAFDTWAQARGLTTGVNAGFFDDPNDDGLPNIQHFAFDSDPLGMQHEECKRQIGFTSVGAMEYLTLTLPIRNGAVFSGNPFTSNVVDGILYEILGNTTLDDPWDLPVVELVPALDAGLPGLGDYDGAAGADWQYRTFRLADSLSASDRYFMRARVTEAP